MSGLLKAIRKLFSGRYPLWAVFWLLGLPLYVVYYMSGGCLISIQGQLRER